MAPESKGFFETHLLKRFMGEVFQKFKKWAQNIFMNRLFENEKKAISSGVCSIFYGSVEKTIFLLLVIKIFILLVIKICCILSFECLVLQRYTCSC